MTVSRVINNKPGVSDDVRQTVLDLAAEMGYTPNFIARSLATRRTATIGLVVPDNTNPFFAQIARGVEDVAYERDYNIFLINTVEDPARETKALESLIQQGADGLILCSSRIPLEKLEEQILRFPAVVVLNREFKNPQANLVSINVNDQRGAELAVEHFLKNGRTKIAYLDGPHHSVSAERRLSGYRAALRANNLPFEPGRVETCQMPDAEGGRAAAAELLARRPDTQAIYAFNDLIAIGALQVCREAGIKVPGDIAIIGVDDIPFATIVRPQLTTLHVNLCQIGRLAMRTLLDTIEGGNPATAIQIEPELIVRESA